MPEESIIVLHLPPFSAVFSVVFFTIEIGFLQRDHDGVLVPFRKFSAGEKAGKLRDQLFGLPLASAAVTLGGFFDEDLVFGEQIVQ